MNAPNNTPVSEPKSRGAAPTNMPTEPEPTARAGRHRVQIIYFFRMQIGSQSPSGIGLGLSSRLRRMRRFLGLSGELWIENFGKSWASEMPG